MTTTSTTNSETQMRRNLAIFDLLNGARIVGESVVGFDRFSVINPALLGSEKGEGDGQVKVSINPIMFTRGTVYQVQPGALVGVYQCFDRGVHEIYERAINGGKADGDNVQQGSATPEAQ